MSMDIKHTEDAGYRINAVFNLDLGEQRHKHNVYTQYSAHPHVVLAATAQTEDIYRGGKPILVPQCRICVVITHIMFGGRLCSRSTYGP